MKTYSLLPVATAAALSFAVLQAADTVSPGFFDLGKFSPPKSGGEFVEVNLKGNLLTMAAKIAARQEPEVGDLLRSIESIRVNVIGLDDSNRSDLTSRLNSIRAGLDSDGWERIVTVQQKGDDVGVYTKTRGADSIAGVVVTVMNHEGQAVFVNVVGDIKPERLAELGEHFNIPRLKAAGKATGKTEKTGDPK